ncbi:hypothetical protein GGP91_003182 [Salinibacter ruber]|nr:hypothetical protein [Salinibacter ruber]
MRRGEPPLEGNRCCTRRGHVSTLVLRKIPTDALQNPLRHVGFDNVGSESLVSGTVGLHPFQPRLFSLVFSTSSFSAAYPFQRLIFHVSGPFASAVLNPGAARRTGAARRKRPVGEKAHLREDPLVREKAEALLQAPLAGFCRQALASRLLLASSRQMAGPRWAGPFGAFLAEVGPPPENPLPENPRLEISSHLENPRLEVGYRLEVGSRPMGRPESLGPSRKLGATQKTLVASKA